MEPCSITANLISLGFECYLSSFGRRVCAFRILAYLLSAFGQEVIFHEREMAALADYYVIHYAYVYCAGGF